MFDTTDPLTNAIGVILLLAAAYTYYDHRRVVKAVRAKRALASSQQPVYVDQDCD